MNANTHKELYEALQAVNARLDAVGEQLLIGLVEALRTSLRAEQAALGGSMPVGTLGQTETTLKIWIEVDAAEQDELVCVGCLTGIGTHSDAPGACLIS